MSVREYRLVKGGLVIGERGKELCVMYVRLIEIRKLESQQLHVTLKSALFTLF